MINRPYLRNFDSRRQHGVVGIYLAFALVVLFGVVSLAVDLSRVQLAKAELSAAADSAAQNGVSFITTSTTAARNAAIAAAAANRVAGTALVLTTSDVVVGTWNTGTRTFTAGGTTPNAVQVSAFRTAARQTALPLFFAAIIGQGTCDLRATATAVLTAGSAATYRVEGIMNPYLAGMPNGTYGGSANSGTAPANSPLLSTGITLTAGQILTFNVTGSTADDPVNINQNWTPDGQPGGIRTNDSGYLNGMSQLTTQQASLVGVFLTASAPNSGATPPALNMSSAAAMDYTSISPQLKQPFFIGDGKRSNGTLHQIVVPAGATRLFLGMHDNVNWANNSGFYRATINGTAARISLQK